MSAEQEAGVWAVVTSNYHDYIQMIFPTEIDALRLCNTQGYGRAVFVPFGKTLEEVKL